MTYSNFIAFKNDLILNFNNHLVQIKKEKFIKIFNDRVKNFRSDLEEDLDLIKTSNISRSNIVDVARDREVNAYTDCLLNQKEYINFLYKKTENELNLIEELLKNGNKIWVLRDKSLLNNYPISISKFIEDLPYIIFNEDKAKSINERLSSNKKNSTQEVVDNDKKVYYPVSSFIELKDEDYQNLRESIISFTSYGLAASDIFNPKFVKFFKNLFGENLYLEIIKCTNNAIVELEDFLVERRGYLYNLILMFTNSLYKFTDNNIVAFPVENINNIKFSKIVNNGLSINGDGDDEIINEYIFNILKNRKSSWGKNVSYQDFENLYNEIGVFLDKEWSLHQEENKICLSNRPSVKKLCLEYVKTLTQVIRDVDDLELKKVLCFDLKVFLNENISSVLKNYNLKEVIVNVEKTFYNLFNYIEFEPSDWLMKNNTETVFANNSQVEAIEKIYMQKKSDERNITIFDYVLEKSNIHSKRICFNKLSLIIGDISSENKNLKQVMGKYTNGVLYDNNQFGLSVLIENVLGEKYLTINIDKNIVDINENLNQLYFDICKYFLLENQKTEHDMYVREFLMRHKLFSKNNKRIKNKI